MAYSDYDQEEKTGSEQGPETPYAPLPAGPTAPGGQAPVGQPQTPGPSNFVSFDRYFDANQAGANKMAGDIYNQTAQSADAATSAIDQTKTDFTRRVNNGTNNPLVNADGTRQYAGPGGLTASDLEYANTKTTDALNNLNNTKSNAGLQNYTDQNYGKVGNYTQGDSRFDAALAGRAGGDRFAELRQRFGGLEDQYKGLNAWGQAEAARGQNSVQQPPPAGPPASTGPAPAPTNPDYPGGDLNAGTNPDPVYNPYGDGNASDHDRTPGMKPRGPHQRIRDPRATNIIQPGDPSGGDDYTHAYLDRYYHP